MANVAYRIPYTCRHTHAAELLSMGVEPGRAAAQLGHSLEMFFRTYSEWIDEYSKGEDTDKLNGNRPDMNVQTLNSSKARTNEPQEQANGRMHQQKIPSD